ncbi:hypothetical protein DITRI_Ditri07aG0121800 [Diplodiscus trichospermus]
MVSSRHLKGFIHQPGAKSHTDSTLTALQNLSYLESLNLEHTQVRDPYFYPLSSFKELCDLSLKCASLTDATLHHLLCLPKLTNLHVCEAVLTNSGLDTFSPPTTLRLLDLMGCWLLTEDSISSFLRKHPQVEIRHEAVQNFSSEWQNIFHHSCSKKEFSGNQKAGESANLSVFCRLKYSREELLALQFSPLSHESSHRTDFCSLNINY